MIAPAARTVLVALLVLATPAAFTKAQPARQTAIVGATVIDPSGAITPDATVLIQGNRIQEVGPRARVKVPEGTTVMDATGKFVVPGLIDAHVHFFQSGGLYTRPDIYDLTAKLSYAEEQRVNKARLDETFARFLRSGVTGVVDVGGPFWNFDVRDRAQRSALAPRVAVTGPLISTVSREALDLGDPPIIRAATPEEARALVRREAARKPDFIKVWFVVSKEEPVEKGTPIVQAVAEEAHSLGLRVAVHAFDLAAAKAALSAGADILVHSVIDVEVDDAFLQLARARKAVYVPTMIVREDYFRTASGQFAFTFEELAWGDPWAVGSLLDLAHLPEDQLPARLKDRRGEPIAPNPVLARNLLKVFQAGIPVAMGTDSGNIGTLHGASVFREMAEMEAAGLTPLEVLRTATAGGALVMGRAGELGRVSEGALADLLVLDADPRLSTRNLARIHRLVRDGHILDPATILPDSPEVLAQRQLNAYNLRDVEAFLAPYAPDVEILALDGTVRLKGLDAMRKRYADIFQKSPLLHCELVKRMAVGSFVLDEERVTGMGDDVVRAIAIYEVKDGRIAKVRFLR